MAAASRSVLRQAGVRREARYVEFVGLDAVERHGQRFGFGGSIDLAKALTPDVLLASELNGAPLPPVHGFPIRSIVPGWIGARSVKWLGRITLAAEPSDNYFQSKAYRVQREIDPANPRDVSGGIPLSEVLPQRGDPRAVERSGRRRREGAGARVGDGTGGQLITAVEVSPNGGADWVPARIAVPGATWTWSLWEATLDLARGRHILAVRATDATGATMPVALGETWNVKGYANNAWHRVAIQAE